MKLFQRGHKAQAPPCTTPTKHSVRSDCALVGMVRGRASTLGPSRGSPEQLPKHLCRSGVQPNHLGSSRKPGFPGPRPASESAGPGGAQEPGIARLSLDWKPLIKAQHLFSHLGKLRPGKSGDLSGLVNQTMGEPGLELGPLPCSFSPFPPPPSPLTWPSASW